MHMHMHMPPVHAHAYDAQESALELLRSERRAESLVHAAELEQAREEGRRDTQAKVAAQAEARAKAEVGRGPPLIASRFFSSRLVPFRLDSTRLVSCWPGIPGGGFSLPSTYACVEKK